MQNSLRKVWETFSWLMIDKGEHSLLWVVLSLCMRSLFLLERRLSKPEVQASKQPSSMPSVSVPALSSFLRWFPSWWTEIRICKPNIPSPFLSFSWCFMASIKSLTKTFNICFFFLLQSISYHTNITNTAFILCKHIICVLINKHLISMHVN